MASKIFAEMLAKVKPENRQFVEKNVAIAFQVRDILNSHPTINSQKALADALGKEPSEISKWLSGLHNIGLENITKMETVLGQDIILTDEQARERYAKSEQKGYPLFQRMNVTGRTGQMEQLNEPNKKKEVLLKHVQPNEGEVSDLAY